MIWASYIGDISSFLGVVFSLCALAGSWNARRLVRRVLTRNRQMLGVLDIQRALEIARRLEAETQHQLRLGDRLSVASCDELRQLIRTFHREMNLSHHESERMRLAIGSLVRVPLYNNDHIQIWVRELVDDLDRVRRRIINELSEP